jgi:two-component system LytT family response regulator
MKVIIVDDESLALRSLERVMNEIGGVDIIGMYQDPRRVIEAVVRDNPDIVFLDIEMPVMNGMRLAEQLLELSPSLNIVFVTAYSEYAVKAYELDALDYIVKPVRHDRLVNTLTRIQAAHADKADSTAPEPVMIRLFRTLQIEYSGQEPELIAWRTAKAQELFAYLVHIAGKLVRKEALNDILWPNSPQKKAYTHLYTTIYQLRKTLSTLNVGIQIKSGDEGYVLERNGLRIDKEEWEATILATPEVTANNINELRRIMPLFRGYFLQEYDYVWAIEERERLNMIWLRTATRIADYLMGIGRFAETIALCHEIRLYHPYSSYSYFMLMKIHAALGERVMVKEQYRKLTDMLSEQLGEQPEEHIIMWFRTWEKIS